MLGMERTFRHTEVERPEGLAPTMITTFSRSLRVCLGVILENVYNISNT